MGWWSAAACRHIPPEQVFSGHGNGILRPACNYCPVRSCCLWSAMLEEHTGGSNAGHRFYMRGGKTADWRARVGDKYTLAQLRENYRRAIVDAELAGII